MTSEDLRVEGSETEKLRSTALLEKSFASYCFRLGGLKEKRSMGNYKALVHRLQKSHQFFFKKRLASRLARKESLEPLCKQSAARLRETVF